MTHPLVINHDKLQLCFCIPGVDVIIDPVGAAYWENHTKCIAMDGRVLHIGLVSMPKRSMVTRYLISVDGRSCFEVCGFETRTQKESYSQLFHSKEQVS